MQWTDGPRTQLVPPTSMVLIHSAYNLRCKSCNNFQRLISSLVVLRFVLPSLRDMGGCTSPVNVRLSASHLKIALQKFAANSILQLINALEGLKYS